MNGIPTLYRSVVNEQAMTNHLLGILWFRSLKYFRTLEGQGSDKLEGIGSYTVGESRQCDVGDERPISPVFILSFSEVRLPKFGKFVLELSDPAELRRRVKTKFPEQSSVEWHKVRYDKTEDLPAVPDLVEDWNRKHYSKPEHFACEKEWRLAIFLPPPFRLLNHTLKSHVGNLQGVFKLMPFPPPGRRPLERRPRPGGLTTTSW